MGKSMVNLYQENMYPHFHLKWGQDQNHVKIGYMNTYTHRDNTYPSLNIGKDDGKVLLKLVCDVTRPRGLELRMIKSGQDRNPFTSLFVIF